MPTYGEVVMCCAVGTWNVVEAGYLVCARAPGEQDPRGRVDQLFQHEEAVALHEGPLHLPDVDGRVQRLPQVHHNVGGQDLWTCFLKRDGCMRF